MKQYWISLQNLERKHVDYLIVGQGLAGSVLACQLLMSGKKIMLIDKGYENSSSIVAAGIINALVLKRLTKSWRAEDFVDYNNIFYPNIQEFLKKDFHSRVDFLKLLSSEEEEKYWLHRYLSEDMKQFMLQKPLTYNNEWIDFNKAGKVLNANLLDVQSFLDQCRKRFTKENSLLEEVFDHSRLNTSDISYRNIFAKSIIFCEGSLAINNPYFNWLPFSLNKGELLSIKSKDLKLEQLINKKIFVLPLGQDVYKIGASNEWKEINNVVTTEKREELLHQFEKLSTADYSIIDQKAGVRPATRDRRPFIGQHPKIEKMYIFNGMGAKATLMSPLLAKDLIEFIENDKKLRSDCDIKRYYKLYQINSPE